MKQITSRANPLYKELLTIVRHAGRRDANVWLEGVHLCEAWQSHYGQPIWAIFDADKLAQPDIALIASQVEQQRQIILTAELMHGLSTMKSSAGVAYVCQGPALALPSRLSSSAIALDEIQDPGNVGTMIRTAAAAGIGHVMATPGSAAAWSPKVLRAGQGAHFAVAIYEGVDVLAWLRAQRTQQAHLPVIATSLEASDSLFEVELPKDCIWVFGHEGRGVSQDLLALADMRIRIDHDAHAVESLNVASAAAICLFEQRRQHWQNHLL